MTLRSLQWQLTMLESMCGITHVANGKACCYGNYSIRNITADPVLRINVLFSGNSIYCIIQFTVPVFFPLQSTIFFPGGSDP